MDTALSADADKLASYARDLAGGAEGLTPARSPEGASETPAAQATKLEQPATVPHQEPTARLFPVEDSPSLKKVRHAPAQSESMGTDSDDSRSSIPECEWDSFSDDETGRRYYYNARTQISVWNEPPAYSNWKAQYRPERSRRAENPRGRMAHAVANAERVASERAAALAAERHRAEEAEATAALLASEAAKLRRYNRELQTMYGASEDSPSRGAPAATIERPPPKSEDRGPSLPNSRTLRRPVAGDHLGSEAESPRGDFPYTPLYDDVRRTPAGQSGGHSIAPPRLEPTRVAMLQNEARAWRGSRRS